MLNRPTIAMTSPRVSRSTPSLRRAVVCELMQYRAAVGCGDGQGNDLTRCWIKPGITTDSFGMHQRFQASPHDFKLCRVRGKYLPGPGYKVDVLGPLDIREDPITLPIASCSSTGRTVAEGALVPVSEIGMRFLLHRQDNVKSAVVLGTLGFVSFQNQNEPQAAWIS